MKRLERWLARQSRREVRRPRLLDALLGYRPLLYVAHRLRFVTLRVLLRTALHLVEIYALMQVFPLEYLGPIVVLRHASTLIQSAWWGALEPQREALRTAYRNHDNGAFATISSRWSALSLVAILSSLIGFGGWLVIAPRPFHGFSIYDAYAIACGLRTSMELFTRTQHSSVFAVARVRRPWFSFILVDLFEVFGLLIVWLRIGPLAFALMLVLTGVLRAGFLLFFVRATRKNLGLPARPRVVWSELLRLRWREVPYRRMLVFSAGNLALQLDSLAIILLSAGLRGDDGTRIQILLYALAPLLGAGYGWSRVFYFDFKSLTRFHSPLLSARFGALLDRTALFFPIVLWLLAWPVVEFLIPGFLGNAPWLLGLFVVARSCFALRQIEAFSYVDFRTELRQLLVLLLGLGLGLSFLPQGALRLPLVSTVLFLAAFVGPRARGRVEPLEPGCVLGLEAWLSHLRSVNVPLRLVSVTIDRSSTRLSAMRRSLVSHGFHGPMRQVGRTLWAFSVPAVDGDTIAIRRRLISATAGAATRLFVGEAKPSGRVLLREGLVESRELTWLLGTRRLPLGTKVSSEALRAQFEARFPAGTCLTERRGRLRNLPELRRYFGRLIVGVSSRGSAEATRTTALNLVVYRPSGRATVLFLLPNTVLDAEAFASFRSQAHEASLQATLNGL